MNLRIHGVARLIPVLDVYRTQLVKWRDQPAVAVHAFNRGRHFASSTVALAPFSTVEAAQAFIDEIRACHDLVARVKLA